jgi:hypothetical protein
MRDVDDPGPSEGSSRDGSVLPSSWAANTGKRGRSFPRRWLFSTLVVVGLVVTCVAVIAYRHGVANAYAKGRNVGYAVGHSDGYTVGNDDGYTKGHSMGFSEGSSDGYDRGLVVGRKDGFSSGYSAGSKGGYSQGWSAGCRAVFTGLGDTTAAAWSDVDGLGFDPSFVSTVSEFSC